MSSTLVDDLATPWQPDASGLWSLRSTAAAARFGADALGMELVSSAGAAGATPPSAERRLAAALDLRDRDELRLWLRSSLPGDGAPGRPQYLQLEVDSDPASGTPWQRVLDVGRAHRWEHVRLSLGDMAAAVRRGARTLRLRSLDATSAFTAAFDDLLAVRPAPLEDIDAALRARLDGAITVTTSNGARAVPVIFDVPEAPGTRVVPYLLVSTLAILPLGPRGAAGTVAGDRTNGGGALRPAAGQVRVDLSIDAVVEDRAQKVALLDALLADLERPLVIAGSPFALQPLDQPGDPGRSPLVYRLTVPLETGEPQFSDLAQALLVVGHADDRPGAETVPA